MGYTKRIVCLANSRKPPSGRCVAGRETRARDELLVSSVVPASEFLDDLRQ